MTRKLVGNLSKTPAKHDPATLMHIHLPLSGPLRFGRFAPNSRFIVSPYPIQSLCRLEKVCDYLHVLLRLLEIRTMTRVANGNPLDLGDISEERRHTNVLRFVKLAVYEQCGHLDLVHLIHHGPSLQRTNDCKLRRSIPISINACQHPTFMNPKQKRGIPT